jgi:hypothetical protein
MAEVKENLATINDHFVSLQLYQQKKMVGKWIRQRLKVS